MAMASAFSTLPVPAQVDDTMEVSSPGNRLYDDDIDIDFGDDLPDSANQPADDEPMLEDDGHLSTAEDATMGDDMHAGEAVDVEEEMQDGPDPQQEQQEDEDLIDYSDVEEYPREHGETHDVPDHVPEHVVQFPESDALQHEKVDHEITPAYDDGAPLPLSENPIEEVSPDIFQNLVPEEFAEVDNAEATTEQATTEQAAPGVAVLEDNVENLDAGENVEEVDDNERQGPSKELSAEAVPKSRLPAAIFVPQPIAAPANGPLSCAPGTPTDTGLHPTTLHYQNHVLPLFKSHQEPHGLLKDDNLASLSLAELMRQCRYRLSAAVGETVSADQELRLEFDELGLELAEDSRTAFETSLDDVLQLYLLLHRNDEALNVPPLTLRITCKLKFSSLLQVLKKAAEGGQGMSSITALAGLSAGEENQNDEDTTGEQGDEEDLLPSRNEDYVHDTGDDGEAASAHSYQDAADEYLKGADDESGDAQQREQTPVCTEEEEFQEGSFGEYQEEEQAVDEYHESEVNENAEESTAPLIQAAETTSTAVDAENGHTTQAEKSLPYDEAHTANQTSTTPGYETAKTDPAGPSRGEYDEGEDIIHWDEDDGLTSDVQEYLDGSNRNEDVASATIAQEPGGAELATNTHDTDRGDTNAVVSDETANHAFDARNSDTQDELGESSELQYHVEDSGPQAFEEEPDGAKFSDHHAYQEPEEDLEGPTDTIGQLHEQDATSDELVDDEDTEPFVTVHELLEDDETYPESVTNGHEEFGDLATPNATEAAETPPIGPDASGAGEDEIDFDDELPHHPRDLLPKRSFEELDEENFDDEPDVKKARSS